MSIFKDTFVPNIRKQIEVRQSAMTNRTPQSLQYLNSRNAWIRMSSSVNVDEKADLAKKYGVIVISDEIHAPLTFPGEEFIPFLAVNQNAAEVGICVTSASKAFNIAGLKSAIIVSQTEKMHELLAKMPMSVHFRSSILGAFAAVTAFNEGEEWLDAALSTIESNAHYLKTILNSQIPAAKYEVPKCSYLAWVDVSNLNLGEDPSAVFLEKGRVAFNAGKIYGPNSSQFVRINLATSESVLAEAVNRMAKSL